MPLRIARVVKGSIADKAGITNDDVIISVNGNVIDDFIGLQFYCSDPILNFDIQQADGKIRKVTITQDWQSKLGIEPGKYQIRKCTNKCIFCFIDQMPSQLRRSLYLKDDDYLFSFVYGNYISLNNLQDKDYKRIVDERISPLYISVHTTNPTFRKQIMGYKQEIDILDKLKFLSQNRISFHTQIVVIPKMNDKEELRKTIIDLTHPDINTLSIGLVPVGLTKHRDDLYPLRNITANEAKEVINLANFLANSTGFSQIYCADELFILSGIEIPSIQYYDDFCQIENGIGMLRAMLKNWQRKQQRFAKLLSDESLLFVTGILAAKYIRHIAGSINHIFGEKRAEVLVVENSFFGDTVTVSGLLTYQDIERELSKRESLPDYLAFSSNMFNVDGFTLDGIHQDELSERWQRKVLVINELWTDWKIIH
ncbi:MAG: DUF512 domain-containing protein [Candidatus Cloacimonetes bacterium]|nr:DUF512 domain-containing protein [Candidatus Cloacimonadota bacterium]